MPPKKADKVPRRLHPTTRPLRHPARRAAALAAAGLAVVGGVGWAASGSDVLGGTNIPIWDGEPVDVALAGETGAPPSGAAVPTRSGGAGRDEGAGRAEAAATELAGDADERGDALVAEVTAVGVRVARAAGRPAAAGRDHGPPTTGAWLPFDPGTGASGPNVVPRGSSSPPSTIPPTSGTSTTSTTSTPTTDTTLPATTSTSTTTTTPTTTEPTTTSTTAPEEATTTSTAAPTDTTAA